MQQLAFPMPRMEIIATSDGMVLSLEDDGQPVALELCPAAALTAGMWLLDAAFGVAAEPLEADGMNVAAILRITHAENGDGRSTMVSINDGVTEGHLVLSPVQTLLAGEHLIAHAVSAGARPAARSAPRVFEATT